MSRPGFSEVHTSNWPLSKGFLSIPLVTSQTFKDYHLPQVDAKNAISSLCDEVAKRFQVLRWDAKPCGDIHWKADLKSQSGKPLIYAEFGDGEETTLFLGGVHPDELTPIPVAFRLARHLAENPEIWQRQNLRVIIAPLVNPDGFLLRKAASRTNKNGVDLNRNFFTHDWYGRAKKWWEDRREKNPAHFPGHFPNSEIETMFQISLIDTYRPDKIMSIHAPLGFLDYDGPGSSGPRKLTATEKKASRIVHAISASTRNYRIVDYSFYPGSLGNYAGNERQIPTLTLELETTDPRKVDEYWLQFLPGFKETIRYPFRNKNALHERVNDDETRSPI